MDSTRSASVARRTGGATVLGVAVAALAGCMAGPPNQLTFNDTEKVKITEIVVGSGSGDVTVRTSAVAETRINRVVSYRGAEPGPTYRVDGTVLHIATDCGDNCGVSYDIDAPTGVAVRGELGSGNATLTDVAAADLQVGSGDVTMTRVTGAVDVRTGSGNITVDDLRDTVRLVAGSGDVQARNLAGLAVTAETSSGNIDLTLTKAAPVTVRAGSGDATVTVPPGSYRVHTDASSGDETLGVRHDPKATVVLDVRTGSGNVSLHER